MAACILSMQACYACFDRRPGREAAAFCFSADMAGTLPCYWAAPRPETAQISFWGLVL